MNKFQNTTGFCLYTKKLIHFSQAFVNFVLQERLTVDNNSSHKNCQTCLMSQSKGRPSLAVFSVGNQHVSQRACSAARGPAHLARTLVTEKKMLQWRSALKQRHTDLYVKVRQIALISTKFNLRSSIYHN